MFAGNLATLSSLLRPSVRSCLFPTSSPDATRRSRGRASTPDDLDEPAVSKIAMAPQVFRPRYTRPVARDRALESRSSSMTRPRAYRARGRDCRLAIHHALALPVIGGISSDASRQSP